MIGIGIYALVIMVFALMAWKPDLRSDEFFKTVSTLIVGAFIKDVVAWAYSATKGGGELASKNADIVANTVVPTEVRVTNDKDDPVSTKEEK